MTKEYLLKHTIPDGYIIVPASAWDEMVQMEAERDALAAQVEAFSSAQSALRDLANELIDHLRYNKAERNEVLDAFWDKLDAIKYVPSTPQQILREIKAAAGRAGFVAGMYSQLHQRHCTQQEQNAAADQYVAKVQGGE